MIVVGGIYTGVTSAVKKNSCSGFLIVLGNFTDLHFGEDFIISSHSQSWWTLPDDTVSV